MPENHPLLIRDYIRETGRCWRVGFVTEEDLVTLDHTVEELLFYERAIKNKWYPSYTGAKIKEMINL